MVAVAVQRATAVDLLRRSVGITIVIEGLTAPRVDLRVPAEVAVAVREAIQWRMAAMRSQAEARAGLDTTARPTLVAVAGVRGETGWCSSCGDAHATTHQGGDCILCHAARVAVLRSLGRLPPAEPVVLTVGTTPEAWQAEISLASFATGGLPLPPPQGPWTCSACEEFIHGNRPEDSICGPCELHEIKVGLGQAIGPRKGRPA